ncbi:MAG: choline-sulfatase, partial [Anaerolineae bacterium]|nr:choline-sulfatase [Anaerolineae bacterium]
DPDELHNLAAEPGFEETRRAFFDEVMALWDPEAVRREVVASQRRRLVVDRALMSGQRTDWDFQPSRDASEQYMRNHMDLDDLERRARFPAPTAPRPDCVN